MEIRKVPISLLNAAPYNPRKDLHPGDPEYQKIARSIEKYGCVEPIIWNEKTGNVIGGHQRLKVLAATGAVEVDVSVVQLSLEDEKALNLALNKISGQWDNEKLSAVLQDLSAGFDVEVTGFDQHEVDALVASFAESGHEYELPGSEPYINNFFDSGVQAKPKAEEPAAAPAPEAPAQDAEMHPSAAPAPNEVQAVQPGGKKTVIVPNLSEQDATTLVDILKDMGFAEADGELAYLKNSHRHIFFITAEFPVHNANREIEIISQQNAIKRYLLAKYGDEDGACHFGRRSCEDIAAEILNQFENSTSCTVLEDGFGGARVVR